MTAFIIPVGQTSPTTITVETLTEWGVPFEFLASREWQEAVFGDTVSLHIPFFCTYSQNYHPLANNEVKNPVAATPDSLICADCWSEGVHGNGGGVRALIDASKRLEAAVRHPSHNGVVTAALGSLTRALELKRECPRQAEKLLSQVKEVREGAINAPGRTPVGGPEMLVVLTDEAVVHRYVRYYPGRTAEEKDVLLPYLYLDHPGGVPVLKGPSAVLNQIPNGIFTRKQLVRTTLKKKDTDPVIHAALTLYFEGEGVYADLKAALKAARLLA